MRIGTGREARTLARRWYLRALPPLVAVLAWRLLPLNAHFAETFLNHDPEGPGQRLNNYREDLLAVHTSGLGAGQWLSLLASVLVTVHDRPPVDELDLARRCIAKLSVAAPYGLLLAGVDLAVALSGIRSAWHARLGRGELACAGNPPDRCGRSRVSVSACWLVDGGAWFRSRSATHSSPPWRRRRRRT
jgi:hypothetical protein